MYHTLITTKLSSEYNKRLISSDQSLEFIVEDNNVLAVLCGPLESHLAHLEITFNVKLFRKGNSIFIDCCEDAGADLESVLKFLCEKIANGTIIQISDINDAVNRHSKGELFRTTKASDIASKPKIVRDSELEKSLEILSRKKVLKPRTKTQDLYLKLLLTKEIIFAIGPAGTGKTYLAIAAAVSQFLKGKVDRIILTRPAVEAGEHLGFLPGDIKDKVDPYMQPLYDSLYHFLPNGKVSKMVESGQIQLVPLAFMRGRTLANSFIILDEAQNATRVQMKMFLTRLGKDSQMVITGDLTQIDLAKPHESGLLQASKILSKIKEIGFAYFKSTDIVRHALVENIVMAYDEHKS